MRNMQADAQIIGNCSMIHEIARQGNVDRIIVALEERRGRLPTEELLRCRMDGISVEEGIAFYEHLTGKLLIERAYPSFLIFSNGFIRSTYHHVVKTAIDLILSFFGLVILLPIMALVALAIKIDSPGPIFYRQGRVGKNGTIFTLLKFRSMKADAEKETGPIWAIENDDRTTRVGKIMRKMRLDEIPQMFNVLRGDMSFVGPRPERPHFVEHLNEEIPFYNKRHAAKPGITGWAQIKYPYGASQNDALEKLKYDLYYMKNMSLFFDLNIIFQTIRIVFFGRGAR
ncbi:MAG: TIGR03013 family XrtA/PEP-CTERM system glycosyltransferase [Candidatus Hodarchaeota archaeon]